MNHSMRQKPLVIGHRGFASQAPENTMVSFKKALDLGVGGLEFDVQMTRDGHLVVCHDEQVDRTTNGKGLIKDYTLAELKKLDAGGWFGPEFAGETIPTLEELFDLLAGKPGLLINAELKTGIVIYPEIEERFIEMVRRYRLTGQILISSFNHYSLYKVKGLAPEMKTGILYMDGLFEPWEYARRVKAEALHPLFYNIQPVIVEGAKRHGLMLNPFTVDDPGYMRLCIEAGVDGIITNYPDRLMKLLEEG